MFLSLNGICSRWLNPAVAPSERITEKRQKLEARSCCRALTSSLMKTKGARIEKDYAFYGPGFNGSLRWFSSQKFTTVLWRKDRPPDVHGVRIARAGHATPPTSLKLVWRAVRHKAVLLRLLNKLFSTADQSNYSSLNTSLLRFFLQTLSIIPFLFLPL